MSLPQQLFFIALLPPQTIQLEVNQIKQLFADRYNSRAAFKSPPHITLYPPFACSSVEIARLESGLAEFAIAQVPFGVTLEGFGAFAPHVIYLHVVKTHELAALQQALKECLETTLSLGSPSRDSDRSYIPHLTVAFRDLSPPNFKLGWAEVQSRSLHYEFMVTHLTLLRHNGQSWDIQIEFPFGIVR
ncbi:MAG: 2'-5' RNA ligase family protein [Scytolyngbya sp. HA4215-MV1]|jgi:2'-5' RNA ligase|nr:2'-5' RNA ligase family protein [Scytolyngbya sp. HA4215-MV1]